MKDHLVLLPTWYSGIHQVGGLGLIHPRPLYFGIFEF